MIWLKKLNKETGEEVSIKNVVIFSRLDGSIYITFHDPPDLKEGDTLIIVTDLYLEEREGVL